MLYFCFYTISSGLRAQSELLNWVISLWGWRETTQIYKYKLSPVWIMLLSVSACTNTNHTAWGWSTCRCLPPTNIQIAPFCKIKELMGAGGGINILVVCVCVCVWVQVSGCLCVWTGVAEVRGPAAVSSFVLLAMLGWVTAQTNRYPCTQEPRPPPPDLTVGQ